jgi:hypothetical protein
MFVLAMKLRTCSTLKKLVRLFLAVVPVTLTASGCDSGPLLVPLHGKVTFNGGPPPAAGVVSFAPLTVTEGLPRRPGRATFDTDGEFQASSFQPGDGLIPGRYGVTIICQKPASSDQVNPQQFSYVRRGYQAPDVVVEASAKEVKLDFDVPLNRPSP